eukprot:SAG31_NODE_115_length_24128_cov_47.693912_12_plen_231_part_00
MVRLAMSHACGLRPGATSIFFPHSAGGRAAGACDCFPGRRRRPGVQALKALATCKRQLALTFRHPEQERVCRRHHWECRTVAITMFLTAGPPPTTVLSPPPRAINCGKRKICRRQKSGFSATTTVSGSSELAAITSGCACTRCKSDQAHHEARVIADMFSMAIFSRSTCRVPLQQSGDASRPLSNRLLRAAIAGGEVRSGPATRANSASWAGCENAQTVQVKNLRCAGHN